MARKDDNVGREMGEGYKYVSLGLTFAGGIIFFLALGFGLDRLLGTTPVFILIGTFLGTILSFISVYRKLQEEERLRRERKNK
ncbi:MAG TPA: AtpZ/AtpI family protein [Anaerolineales bacterium]